MDQARKKTDKKLQQVEKKVNKIYRDAYTDISEDWNKFMDSHYPKLEAARKNLEEAKKLGNSAEIKEAEDAYERTAKNITVNNRRYQSMVNETTEKIAHTNEIALSYVNDQLPGIYTTNYNAFGEEKIKGYSFSLVNEAAVKELATKDKTLLPTKKLDIPKDKKWNEKNINSQMLQGILQGESIPKMAKRLMNVTDMNRASAIRNARTMTTAAENKGRNDSYHKAAEDGVIMKRIWVATQDDRTRAWHSDLDGVEVDLDEPWENEYGEISYPGDPSADPANVYNCRCAMRVDVKGFKWNLEEGDWKEETAVPPKDELSLSGYDEERLGKELFEDEIFTDVSKEELEDKLTDIFDKNDYCMRVDSDNLDSILNTHFKSSEETGTGAGAGGVGARIEGTQKMFDLSDETIETMKESPEMFEKYGYLGDRNLLDEMKTGSMDDYGNIRVIFNKDDLNGRTTYTYGDSVFRGAPFGQTKAGLISEDGKVGYQGVAFSQGTQSTNEKAIEKSEKFINQIMNDYDKYDGVMDFTDNTVYSYFELQYHGELTADNVKTLQFINKSDVDNLSENAIEIIKEKGITIQVVEDDKIVDIDLEKLRRK